MTSVPISLLSVVALRSIHTKNNNKIVVMEELTTEQKLYIPLAVFITNLSSSTQYRMDSSRRSKPVPIADWWVGLVE